MWTNAEFGFYIGKPLCGRCTVYVGRWRKPWLIGLLTGFEIHFVLMPDGVWAPQRCWCQFFGHKWQLFDSGENA